MKIKNVFQKCFVAILSLMAVLPLTTGAVVYTNVITHPAAAILETGAILNGELASLAGASNATVWFQYGQTVSYGSQSTQQNMGQIGTFYSQVSGLTSCTTYHFRAVSQNSNGLFYGADQTFTTQCTGSGVVLKANNSIDNITVNYNQPVTLSWQGNNVSSCSASGDWSGVKATSGTEQTGALAVTKTYSITCSGQTGSVSDTITVYVGSQPTLSVALEAVPASGRAPLNNVDLKATISGQATGNVRYQFDCQNDGSYEKDITISTEPFTPYVATSLCNYQNTGTYTAKVKATRGGQTAENTAQVVVGNVNPSQNNKPAANAGTDKNIYENDTIILNGSGSDPDGDPITYSWTCTGGNLNNYTIAQPTYTAPSVQSNSNYSCTLTVSDNRGLSDTDSVNIYVQKRISTAEVETQPVSNLQTSQATLNGYLRNLGGSNSATVWFQWGNSTSYGYTTQTAVMYNTGSFYNTLTGLSQNTVYHYRAVAQTSQGIVYGQDMVFTTQGSSQSYPYANAGNDKTVNEGASVVLDGSGNDSQGGYVTYSWTCTGGNLNNTNVAQPIFYAPQVSQNTNYTCTLTVRNSYGLSNSDSMVVTVVNQGGGSQGNLTVNKTVRSLTKGDGNLYETVYASPYDEVLFSISIQNNSQDTVSNVYFRDNLPNHLIYNNQMTIDGAPDTRVPTVSDIYIGDLSPGQTKIITFKAKVDAPTYFNYGQTSLVNTVNVYGQNTSLSDTATVIVTRTYTGGATGVNTGLADTIFNSLLLPLLIAGGLIFLFKSQVVGLDKWFEKRKGQTEEFRAQKKLEKTLKQIKGNS